MLKNYQHVYHIILSFVFFVAVTASEIPVANAADINTFSVSLSTIEESVVANQTITFTINDAWSATETLTIDYPDGFDLNTLGNSEPEDFDITDDAAEKIQTVKDAIDFIKSAS